MRFSIAIGIIAYSCFLFKGIKGQDNICNTDPIPLNENDFNEPAWEDILEQVFPTWTKPTNGCPRLDKLGGSLLPDFKDFPKYEAGKWNPCYYTKAFASLDASLGGYPTPIDTHYPYEFAAPFFRQPGDGSVKHCDNDAVDIGACQKLGLGDCGDDCASITDDYGIGHIPPFVPLAALKKEYQECSRDICNRFHYETSGCNIKKSALDEIVYRHFGEGTTIKFQPPVLIGDKPSNTYFRLEYGKESPACDEGNCRGPHYCTKEVADAGVIWGDFCPYVSTGENSGKYRHPHLALAALELWIANKCMPDKCPKEWLESPNGKNYAKDEKTSTAITWCEMDDNDFVMAQPKVPYQWPNTDSGKYPGLKRLYGDAPKRSAKGLYVNELMTPATQMNDETSGASNMATFFAVTLYTMVTFFVTL